MALRPAPQWHTTDWLNTTAPLSLDQLRGKVVLLHAFQMHCQGCVERGLPQAQRVAEVFAGAPLVVVGLHTVFEQHEAMTREALAAFIQEKRIRFPIGVDEPDPAGGVIPRTMKDYAMQGTPTTVLIDAQGRLRRHVFGTHDDLQLGAELQALLLEAQSSVSEAPKPAATPSGCDDQSCALPSDEGAKPRR